MLLALVPAWIAGRSLIDLLLIYPSQAGQYEQLSMHAPTVYSWLPDSGQFYPYFYPAGLLLAATTAIFFTVFIYRGQARDNRARFVGAGFDFGNDDAVYPPENA